MGPDALRESRQTAISWSGVEVAQETLTIYRRPSFSVPIPCSCLRKSERNSEEVISRTAGLAAASTAGLAHYAPVNCPMSK